MSAPIRCMLGRIFDPLKSQLYNLAAASIYLSRGKRQSKESESCGRNRIPWGTRCLSIVPKIPEQSAWQRMNSSQLVNPVVRRFCTACPQKPGGMELVFQTMHFTMIWCISTVRCLCSLPDRQARMPDYLIGLSPLLIRVDPCVFCFESRFVCFLI